MIALSGWIAALAVGAWVLRLRAVLGWRTELAARACHELRGPITVARLGLESAARDTALGPEALNGIDLELESAGVALEDLSAAFAGRRGPWRVDAVDAPALLAESVAAHRPLALARGVDLSLHWRGARAVIPADRLRLAQATGNLIANAIEHGGGCVELSGHAGDHGLEIEVTDAGQGLPSPVTDLIAHPRAGRGRRGRGLAIAAEVAQRHGGRLVAGPGEDGSRVVLTIPLRRER